MDHPVAKGLGICHKSGADNQKEFLMFPHEAQELMAKIVFFIFATCILCLSKVNAAVELIAQ
jgi:hypothetical protein